MKSYEKEKVGYFGTAALLVIFFLFIVSFSNKTSNRDSVSFHSVKILNLDTDFSLNQNKAVITDAIQFSAINMNLFVNSNLKINFYNNNIKLIADNSILKRQFVTLRENELQIKPILIEPFLILRIRSNTDDLPILS